MTNIHGPPQQFFIAVSLLHAAILPGRHIEVNLLPAQHTHIPDGRAEITPIALINRTG